MTGVVGKSGAKPKYDLVSMKIGDIIIAENKSTSTMVSLINHRMKYHKIIGRKYSCRKIGENVHIIRIM